MPLRYQKTALYPRCRRGKHVITRSRLYFMSYLDCARQTNHAMTVLSCSLESSNASRMTAVWVWIHTLHQISARSAQSSCPPMQCLLTWRVYNSAASDESTLPSSAFTTSTLWREPAISSASKFDRLATSCVSVMACRDSLVILPWTDIGVQTVRWLIGLALARMQKATTAVKIC